MAANQALLDDQKVGDQQEESKSVFCIVVG